MSCRRLLYVTKTHTAGDDADTIPYYLNINMDDTLARITSATKIDDGDSGSETTIPAGTKLTYIMTDNNLAGYVTDEHEECYKITIDAAAGAHTIQGTAVTELLEADDAGETEN